MFMQARGKVVAANYVMLPNGARSLLQALHHTQLAYALPVKFPAAFIWQVWRHHNKINVFFCIYFVLLQHMFYFMLLVQMALVHFMGY